MSGMDHVAIVGGDFSGPLQAIDLLRGGVRRVTLIERGALFGFWESGAVPDIRVQTQALARRLAG